MADDTVPQLVANRYKLLVNELLTDLQRFEELPPLDEETLDEELYGLYEDILNWEHGHPMHDRLPSCNGCQCVPSASTNGHQILKGVGVVLQRLSTRIMCAVMRWLRRSGSRLAIEPRYVGRR